MKKYILSIGIVLSVVLPSFAAADYNGVAQIGKSSIPSYFGSIAAWPVGSTGGAQSNFFGGAQAIYAYNLTNGDQYEIYAGGGCGFISLASCQDENGGGDPVIVWVIDGLFYTNKPAPVVSSTLFPAATGNVPTLTGDSFSATEEIVAGIFGIFIVVLGLQLTFYFVNSLVDLMTLRRGGKVKKISRLTAFMDRQSSAARSTRRAWSDDV